MIRPRFVLVASALTVGCGQGGDPSDAGLPERPLIAVEEAEERTYPTAEFEGVFSIVDSCLVLTVPGEGQYTPVFGHRPRLSGPGAEMPKQPRAEGVPTIRLGERMYLGGGPLAEGASGPPLEADIRRSCPQRLFIVGSVENPGDRPPREPFTPPLPERR